jgi:predicted site-specific integrase-resolvase
MADANKIKHYKTEFGQRRYDVDDYLSSKTAIKTICYCRVSSYKQKDDLQKQIKFMSERFPEAEIVKDIGSGLNYKRKGLNSILRRAMSGEPIKLVFVHKDRITKFDLELVTLIIEENGGELLVLNNVC